MASEVKSLACPAGKRQSWNWKRADWHQRTQRYPLGWAGTGRGAWAVGEMVDWECGEVSMVFCVHT